MKRFVQVTPDVNVCAETAGNDGGVTACRRPETVCHRAGLRSESAGNGCEVVDVVELLLHVVGDESRRFGDKSTRFQNLRLCGVAPDSLG